MTTKSETQRETSRVIALIGPTNTGKTHRAIERMLDFEHGMMGLPLRLLAREVYDKVSTRVGEQAVALVTGEEKRVPPRPRYWICTVEAMPPDLEVDFLAVDEIQLMSHPERGHVFTDRLLHARGLAETWFLGSDIVEGLIREWIPQVQVKKQPRLSKLVHAGQSSLRTLPKRSAVVTFNMPHVYELADVLRVRRGGAAVVLGALSPRVRNAQVALYQSGEVDFLVATDAIGMGLNLDVDHVALASRTKFDGFETRELDPPETAQIVGRAGRYLREGTFGTLSPEPELPPRLVQSLETHRFGAQRTAYYRQSALDFESVDALLRSLSERPPGQSLKLAPEGDDLTVLRTLLRKPEVTALATNRERIRILWDVCRIPNYEKLIPDHQAALLFPVFEALATRGVIAADYVTERLRRLERLDGDIHHLLDALSSVRTWTYVSHQAQWVEQAERLREESRALEDRLSDLLHQRLLDRFVSVGHVKGGQASPSVPESSALTHPFAKLKAHHLYRDPAQEAARQKQDWVERVVSASMADLTLSPKAEVFFSGERIARLEPGQGLLRPALKLRLPDWVSRGAEARIERRLLAHLKDVVSELLRPLALGPIDSAPLRGLLYQLEQGLGTVDKRQVRAQLAELAEAERATLTAAQIEVGRFTVWSLPMLSVPARGVRLALCQANLGRELDLSVFAGEPTCVRLPRKLPRPLAYVLGYVPLQTFAVRCDRLESVSQALPELEQDAARVQSLMTALTLSEADALALLRELPRKRRRR